MALSKADLLPALDVVGFQHLLVEHAAGEVEQLRLALAGMVEGSTALSVGEDFLLLSSARFAPEQIRVAERIGVDLTLPVAAVLPFERHVRWAKAKLLPKQVLAHVLRETGAMAFLLTWIAKRKLPGPVGQIVGALIALLPDDWTDKAVLMLDRKLDEVFAEAIAHHDYLTACLTRFRLDLHHGEQRHELLRSPR